MILKELTQQFAGGKGAGSSPKVRLYQPTEEKPGTEHSWPITQREEMWTQTDAHELWRNSEQNIPERLDNEPSSCEVNPSESDFGDRPSPSEGQCDNLSPVDSCETPKESGLGTVVIHGSNSKQNEQEERNFSLGYSDLEQEQEDLANKQAAWEKVSQEYYRGSINDSKSVSRVGGADENPFIGEGVEIADGKIQEIRREMSQIDKMLNKSRLPPRKSNIHRANSYSCDWGKSVGEVSPPAKLEAGQMTPDVKRRSPVQSLESSGKKQRLPLVPNEIVLPVNRDTLEPTIRLNTIESYDIITTSGNTMTIKDGSLPTPPALIINEPIPETDRDENYELFEQNDVTPVVAESMVFPDKKVCFGSPSLYSEGRRLPPNQKSPFGGLRDSSLLGYSLLTQEFLTTGKKVPWLGNLEGRLGSLGSKDALDSYRNYCKARGDNQRLTDQLAALEVQKCHFEEAKSRLEAENWDLR